VNEIGGHRRTNFIHRIQLFAPNEGGLGSFWIADGVDLETELITETIIMLDPDITLFLILIESEYN
jgi:hypothetical protein